MIEIRRASPDEWKTVREVRLAALRDSPDWFWAVYDEELDKPEAWWRRFIEAGAWFIAYEEANPVGIAAAIHDRDLEDSSRRLISMWVAPHVRNRGIGTQLVDAVKAWARDDGATQLELEVTEGNDAAARLYEQCGFEATGRTMALPRNPELIEREMRLQVRA